MADEPSGANIHLCQFVSLQPRHSTPTLLFQTLSMATLSFSLEPLALFRLHDALACLTKFNESVSIEADYDMVIGSTGSRFAWS